MRKTDTLPISRVPSSIRLSPFPGTPQPPSSTTPSIIKDPEDEKFESLKIVQTVNEFENKISLLSQKVTSFNTVGLDEVVQDLININETFEQELEQLKKHQNLKTSIEKVGKDQEELDTKSKDILRKLISYRSQLKQLPSLPTKGPIDQTATIDIEEVLKYGSKLSKFTKIPPGNIGAHPNNFIWPAEDSLRRGTLAISSLRGEEIIARELGEEAVKSIPESIPEPKTELEAKPEPKVEIKEHKPESRPPKTKPKEEAALDLDLFDPEIDSD